MLTSRLAPMHSLCRGLIRRALFNSALLLDDEDLMDYESRKKVGYSIVMPLMSLALFSLAGEFRGCERLSGICLLFKKASFAR